MAGMDYQQVKASNYCTLYAKKQTSGHKLLLVQCAHDDHRYWYRSKVITIQDVPSLWRHPNAWKNNGSGSQRALTSSNLVAKANSLHPLQ